MRWMVLRLITSFLLYVGTDRATLKSSKKKAEKTKEEKSKVNGEKSDFEDEKSEERRVAIFARARKRILLSNHFDKRWKDETPLFSFQTCL